MFVENPRSEEQNPVGCNLLTDYPLAFHDLSAQQRQDSELIQIIQDLESGECSRYQLHKNILYYTTRRGKDRRTNYCSTDDFEFYHSSPVGGHLGVYKTLQKIREFFYMEGYVTGG